MARLAGMGKGVGAAKGWGNGWGFTIGAGGGGVANGFDERVLSEIWW